MWHRDAATARAAVAARAEAAAVASLAMVDGGGGGCLAAAGAHCAVAFSHGAVAGGQHVAAAATYVGDVVLGPPVEGAPTNVRLEDDADGGKPPVRALAWRDDDGGVAAARMDGVRVVDPRAATVVATIPTSPSSLAWCPGASGMLAVGCASGDLEVWDTRAGGGRPAARIRRAHVAGMGPSGAVAGVGVVAPGCHLLASCGSTDGALRMWDGRVVGGGGSDCTSGVKRRRSGAGSAGCVAQVCHRVTAPGDAAHKRWHDLALCDLQLSHDSRHLLLPSRVGRILLYRTEDVLRAGGTSGRCAACCAPAVSPPAAGTAVDVSPLCTCVPPAAGGGGGDGDNTTVPVQQLVGHAGGRSRLNAVFSGCGQYIAGGSDDHAAYIWRLPRSPRAAGQATTPLTYPGWVLPAGGTTPLVAWCGGGVGSGAWGVATHHPVAAAVWLWQPAAGGAGEGAALATGGRTTLTYAAWVARCPVRAALALLADPPHDVAATPEYHAAVHRAAMTITPARRHDHPVTRELAVLPAAPPPAPSPPATLAAFGFVRTPSRRPGGAAGAGDDGDDTPLSSPPTLRRSPSSVTFMTASVPLP